MVVNVRGLNKTYFISGGNLERVKCNLRERKGEKGDGYEDEGVYKAMRSS